MQEKDKKKKIPSSVKAIVDARKKAEESIKASMQPSQQIVEIMKHQLNSVEHLRKLASPTSHIAEMMRQIKQQQQVYADMIRPLKNIAIPDYASEIRQIMSQFKFSNSAVAVLRQFRQAFDTTNMFKSIIVEQREAQRRIVEALKPSFQVQRSMALELSRINSWQYTFKSITNSLKDFRPAVEVLKDVLVIERNRFTQEDINQIAEEYIWDENSEKNIFKQDGRHLSWESIPKPVRWLIALIVATVFTIYFAAIWKEATKNTAISPERVARRLMHFRKQEVRQINKKHQNETTSPFVNTEYLLVHTVPEKRSQAVEVLSYPCEVKILKFKNKKRWALIEWADGSNEVCHGWVLGRYIYRKNTSNSE